MFERLLERILQNFLAPYVSGLSPEALKFGVRSGILELKNLTVKPEALSLLGCLGYQVKNGKLGLVSLHVSWKSLFTGRLYIAIKDFHLEAWEEGIPPEEMRIFKSKTIDLRMGQLQEMLDHSQALQAGDFIEEGFLMRLNRKIITNLSVDISNVAVWMVTTSCPQAVGVDLVSLTMYSTDTGMNTHKNEQLGDDCLYKQLRMERLGLRLSKAGVSDISTATDVLSPMSAFLRLTHAPSAKLLLLRVELGTLADEEKNQIVLRQSQWVHFFKVLAEAAKAAQALQESLVPAEVQRAILLDVEANATEYGRLYEKHFFFERGQGAKLSEQDRARMQMLQDALPVRPLAQQRWLTSQTSSPTIVQSFKHSNNRRSWGDWMRNGFWCNSSCNNEEVVEHVEDTKWFKDELRERLVQEMDAVCNLEEVQRPAQTRLEFVFRELSIFIIDDQWTSPEAQELLSLVLPTALMSIELENVVDSKGEEITEWGIYCNFGAWKACHACQRVLFHTESAVVTKEQTPREMTDKFAAVDAGEERPSAAQLVVESKLDHDSTILKIEFKSTPFEILLLPGIIGRIIEFFTINDEGVVAVAEQMEQMVSEDEKMGPNNFLQQGLDVLVQQQIPDRLFLNLLIAAPVLRAPVQGRGHLVLCPGQLRVYMDEPCAYDKLDLIVSLSDTVLSAVAANGQHFNMIQPVPISVTVKTRDTSTDVEVSVLEMLPLSLAPESFEMLIYLPDLVTSILDETELPPEERAHIAENDFASSEEVLCNKLTSEEPSEAPQPRDTRDTSKWRSDKSSRRDRLLTGAAALVSQDYFEEALFSPTNNQQVVNGLRGASTENMIVTTSIYCDRITLTLADMLMSMLRLQLQLPEPGVVIRVESVPERMHVDVDTSRLELEALCHNGVWEPVIETFTFGLSVRQPPEYSPSNAIGVAASGHTPLLVNLTPTAFAKINRSVELITEGIAAATSEVPKGTRSFGKVAKYRAMNLCNATVELSFATPVSTTGGKSVSQRLAPTGSRWSSLDAKVLPTFATSVAVRVGSHRFSRALQFDMGGAVVIPGTALIAEMFTPSEGCAHRLLLVAPLMRILNTTDTPLQVRFSAGAEGDPLAIPLEPTMVCSAKLLGMVPTDEDRGKRASIATNIHGAEECCAPGLVLPGAMLAVPDMALSVHPQADQGVAQCWLSVGHSDTEFSAPVNVGSCLETRKVFRCKPAGDKSGPEEFIEWEVSTHSMGHSSRCRVTTVKLRPPVLVLNAVPMGTLHLRYGQLPEKAGSKSAEPNWCEASVPKFESYSLFNVAAALTGDLVISARLDKAAPWSTPVVIPWATLQNPQNKETFTVDVLQTKKGAAVGLAIETLDGFKLRISCPYWFVDCSGIQSPFSLEVQQHKSRKRLPSQPGLTLLPNTCHQESISLVLWKQASIVSTIEGTMPPNWCTWAWSAATNQPYVFCIQVERVDPRDLFGAECKAFLLKPRLILTNTSEEDLELAIGKVSQTLEAGTSTEFHWAVGAANEETPGLELVFRPTNTFPMRHWSSVVHCSEVSAGSTPFLLRVQDMDTVDVWSVEIAPHRGSLAVTFKRGSNFIAKHNAPLPKRKRNITGGSTTTSGAGGHSHSVSTPSHDQASTMVVRPRSTAGAGAAVPFSQFRRTSVVCFSDMPVEPGSEVPFGWLDPFSGAQQRAVDVIINEEVINIPDVRQTTSVKVPGSNLILRVARQGVQTILVLEANQAEGKLASPIQNDPKDDGGLVLNLNLCQVGISFIEESPQLRELLYVHLEPLTFLYRDTDSDAHELQLEIDSAQVDCQLPSRREETPAASRMSRVGMMARSADVWRPAVVLRNVGCQPFLSLSLSRSATSSGDIVLPKADLAIDKVEVRVDDDWLESLINWCNTISSSTSGLDQTLPFCDVEGMAGRRIAEGYTPPSLPSVVQVEALSIGDVKLVLFCRLRLHSLSFLPQYVLTAVRAVSLSNYFTLNGASVSLKRRAFPSHRGSTEDFLAALGAEYGRSVVANIFSLLHRSSLLNLPRAPLKIGHGAMTGMAKGVRHVAESAPFEVFTKSGGSEKNEENGNGSFKVARRTEIRKFFSLTQRMSAEKRGKAKTRKRPPRLLLSAVGEVRAWSSMEASLLAQLGRILSSELHEVVPLMMDDFKCVFLLLCSEKILVTCIDNLSNTGVCDRFSLISGSSAQYLPDPEFDPKTFFADHYAGTLHPLAELRGMQGKAQTVRWGESEIVNRRVRGIHISQIRKVLRDVGDEGTLKIEEMSGEVQTLVLPASQVSKAVREAIADGLCCAIAEGDGDANWVSLRTILYGERRGMNLQCQEFGFKFTSSVFSL